jgi:PPOX class probable F420-dependent enzyme
VTDEVRAFLEAHRVGALATTKADGSPRQSIVFFVLDGDHVDVSTVADRGKARDVRRTGRASLCVVGDEAPFPSATVSGPAEILTERIGPATAAVVQRVTGAAEPPEPQTDEALAAVGRVILRIEIERESSTYV